MKQRTLYQVRVTQEIPFCDYDEDGEETQVSSGRIEEYVAGRFSAEHTFRNTGFTWNYSLEVGRCFLIKTRQR